MAIKSRDKKDLGEALQFYKCCDWKPVDKSLVVKVKKLHERAVKMVKSDNIAIEYTSIVGRISDYICIDGESVKEIDDKLETMYIRSDEDDRLIIDRLFIAVCGWSLNKILSDMGKIN